MQGTALGSYLRLLGVPESTTLSWRPPQQVSLVGTPRAALIPPQDASLVCWLLVAVPPLLQSPTKRAAAPPSKHRTNYIAAAVLASRVLTQRSQRGRRCCAGRMHAA